MDQNQASALRNSESFELTWKSHGRRIPKTCQTQGKVFGVRETRKKWSRSIISHNYISMISTHIDGGSMTSLFAQRKGFHLKWAKFARNLVHPPSISVEIIEIYEKWDFGITFFVFLVRQRPFPVSGRFWECDCNEIFKLTQKNPRYVAILIHICLNGPLKSKTTSPPHLVPTDFHTFVAPRRSQCTSKARTMAQQRFQRSARWGDPIHHVFPSQIYCFYGRFPTHITHEIQWIFRNYERKIDIHSC